MTKITGIIKGTALALVTFVLGSAQADIDPKAQEIIDQVSEHYKGLKSYVVDVQKVVNLEANGQTMEIEVTAKAAFEKPNRFRQQVQEGDAISAVSDGETIFADAEKGIGYLKSDAPADFEEIFTDYPMLMNALPDQMIFGLLSPEPGEWLMEGVTDGTYKGTMSANGMELHHLAFSQKGMDWELWVETGDTPNVWRVKNDMSEMLKQGGQSGSYIQNVYYSNPSKNQELAAETWAFEAPKGKKSADNLMQALTGMSPPLKAGDEAPDFNLSTLDGQTVTLAQHAGEVVLLDFWASWCGPCRKGLPIVDKVAAEFSDQEFSAYAVNVGETNDTAKRFMQQAKISLPTLLDQSRSASTAYGAMSIPTTAIIGRDGTIKAYHVGLLPNMEGTLRNEIRAALAEEKPSK